MMIYRGPECGGEELAICAKVWVNFPDLTVEPENAEDAEPTVDDHALCRNPDCQHEFEILEKSFGQLSVRTAERGDIPIARPNRDEVCPLQPVEEEFSTGF